ncbi:hypothetical protein APHAL10511_001615 [Amanita phalloides]|nr:hypothetical protein APHAL10511_001615 [Amanita phalloides]
MALSSSHPEHRPASSASYRSSSSASIQRPSSSLSARPRSNSGASTSRPQSRISRRPSSRHGHRTQLQPFAQALVTQIMGLREEGVPEDPEGQKFKDAVEFVLKSVESTTLNKAAVSTDMHVMDQQIHGYALKARINSHDALSEALQMSYQRVKDSVAKSEDLDHGIKLYRLPDHLQFLVNLSQPPSASTLDYAEELVDALKNPPPPPKPLTWADILAEEPFEGEHWEGVYGLPPGSVRGLSQDTTRDWDSTPSLSPLESDLEFDGDDTDSILIVGSRNRRPTLSEHEHRIKSNETNKMVPSYTTGHYQSLENTKSKQYWRENWKSDVDSGKEFDVKDVSTLGPTLYRTLSNDSHNSRRNLVQSPERYINEYDAVREVLMAFQGRQNLLYSWKDDGYTATAKTPRFAHLSILSQNSILASLASLASTIQNLRIFCSRVLAHSQQRIFNHDIDRKLSSPRISRTVEAFADAVDAELRIFDQWCAAREEDMCRALNGVYSDDESSLGLIVSLLNTEKAVRDRFGLAFGVLLEVVRSVVPELVNLSQANDRRISLRSRARPPSVVVAALIDTLFARAQEHIERGEEGDTFTGGVLMRVFVHAAEPVWSMTGDWLRDGMGIGIGTGNQDEAKLEDEFFIESTGLGLGMMGSGLLDPDFWKEGYSLREGVERASSESIAQGSQTRAIPMFLEHVAEPVLGAGKAIGLLRALGILPPTNSQDQWTSFSALVSSNKSHSGDGRSNGLNHEQTEKLFAVSVDMLSRLIYDGLTPRCEAAGALLTRVLVEECDLWDHLKAIEDLYFMRRGDAMSHFTDLVFAKMDAQLPWGDFHFLNTAFADVVAASISTGQQTQWIRPFLVRFSYRNNGSRDKDRSIDVTVGALDGLSVDYAVPFPLAYILHPRVVQIYGELFVFLLQTKRAKSVLERILVRGAAARHELKPFYAIRGRLSWFVNTLLNFLTTNVIHTQVLEFHEKFRAAKSLDEAIKLHDEHINMIRSQCFLEAHTSKLHKAILSILDMCLHFSHLFVAFAGETTTTHDVSRQSISMRRHRSRRLRRQRRNIIGFTQILREQTESSSSSDDDQNVPETSFSMTSLSISIAEIKSSEHLDKLSKELDELVRFVRRGVESLANAADNTCSTFKILAFALEDWDL